MGVGDDAAGGATPQEIGQRLRGKALQEYHNRRIASEARQNIIRQNEADNAANILDAVNIPNVNDFRRDTTRRRLTHRLSRQNVSENTYVSQADKAGGGFKR